MAESGLLELLSPNAAGTYYNLLVQGFRVGHLSLEKEVPPGLAQLPDPYDSTANAPYWYLPYLLHDLSYYEGRLYLYFGVTPALILFWPYVTLTGHYLFHRQATLIFCTVGFLASTGLLCALWRRYFAGVGVGVITACALALGLATGLSVLLSQADVNQVAISCGYMLTMLALGAIWRALHEPGTAVSVAGNGKCDVRAGRGSPALLLFGAIILVVPVIANVARAMAPKACGTAGRDHPDRTHRFGTDGLQRTAIRQSVRIRTALSVGRDQSPGLCAEFQFKLSLV